MNRPSAGSWRQMTQRLVLVVLVLSASVLWAEEGQTLPDRQPSGLEKALNQLRDEAARLRLTYEAALEGIGEQEASQLLQWPRLLRLIERESVRNAEEAAELQRQIEQLMLRLKASAEQSLSRPPKPSPPTRSADPEETSAATPQADDTASANRSQPNESPLVVAEGPVDPIGLGEMLFRAGKYQQALEIYGSMDSRTLSPPRQLWVQYQTATCLRKLGQLSEAAAIYREVAGSKHDELLPECARRQLSLLQWREELKQRLHQLRGRRETLEMGEGGDGTGSR